MRRLLLFVWLLLLMATAALAQQVTPAVPAPDLTEIPPAARFTATPNIPHQGEIRLYPIVPNPNDARLATCAAPTLEGFLPYVVRPGDRLDVLLTGYTMITVTQLAALNCLDDPTQLPVGAVIWLPRSVSVFTASSVSPVDAVSPAAIRALTAEAGDNTSGATLTWTAQGEHVYLYPCVDAENCVRPQTAQPVPAEGSLRVYPFATAGEYTYRLEATAGDQVVTEDVSFTITCAQDWIGGLEMSRCPEDPPLAVMIAYQPFEHGALIWFSDTLEIYVLTDDGRVRVYEDIFREGAPDPTAEAPEGLLTPVRGFGLIWDLLGGTESGLGWATAPEMGFDSARQAAGRTSYTTYILAPENTVYAVTLIPGLEVGYWSQVR